MDLGLSDDQELFRDTTSRFLADTCPLSVVRSLEDDPTGFDRDWWRQGAELGWTSMLAPETSGGGSISGNGLHDLALIAFERGRSVSPGPLVPTNTAVAVLTGAGAGDAHQELVAGLIAGDEIVTLALDEPGRAWGVRGITAQLRGRDGGFIVDGHKSPVEAGAQASAHLVSCRGETGEPVLVLVPASADGVGVRPRATVDLVRRYAAVDFDGVEVDEAAVVARGAIAIDRCLDIANVVQLAETLGAIDRVFEFTLEWAFDRHTFGRPLASYQELKHRFADMKLWLEASKATVGAAIRGAGEGRPDASELVSTAKSYVSQYAPELVQDCVQIHGGIGVTWDHDIHLYLRRVTLNSLTYGTARDHRERLAAMILDGG